MVRVWVGKETVSRALYGDGVSLRNALATAAVLGNGTSGDEARTLGEELRRPHNRTFENLEKIFSE